MMKRMNMAGLMAVFSAQALWAGSVAFASGDGLSLSINDRGQISRVQVAGQDLLSARAPSGIEIEDVAAGTSAAISGKVTQADGWTVITGTSQALGLAVTARVESMGDHVAMNIRVTDPAGRDRAIRAKVVLNLKDKNWTWCHDLTDSHAAKVNERNVNLGTYAGHGQSAFPFAAIVAGDQTGLAIGWPMANPRFCTQDFVLTDTGVGRLVLSVDLGLAKETAKFPGSADFDVVLYRFDGKDRFRGALKKYYKLYPDLFVYKFPKQGLWTLWLGEGLEGYAKRWGVVYHEAEFDLGFDKMFVRDDKSDIMSFQYTEPWGYYHPMPKGLDRYIDRSAKPGSPLETVFQQKPLYDAVVADLGSKEPSDRFPGMTRGQIAQAILNTAVWRDPDGRWMGYLYKKGGFDWGARKGSDQLVIIANADPELPRPNRWTLCWEGQFLHAEKLAKKLGAKMDGIYLDSLLFYMGLDQMNFRRDQWKYADLPLTYTTLANGKVVPAQALILAAADFLRPNMAEAHKRGWPVIGNGWHPIYAVTAAWLDVLSAGECTSVDVFVGQPALGYFRCMAGRKPVSIMDYVLHTEGGDSVTPKIIDTVIEPRINHYLMYGVYPGTANCWTKERIEKIKMLTPVFEKYFPIFHAINLAGWEPVSRATVAPSNILHEQWGRNLKSGVYFTLHNLSDKAVSPRVEVDLASLGKGAERTIRVRELVSSTDIPGTVTGGKLTFVPRINGKRTIAVKIEE